MNSLTKKNALLTYTKDTTMHVQSTTTNINCLTSEGTTTPNTKNLEKVWSPNKFIQKKSELITLALDNPLQISWSCLKKQSTTKLEENKTNTKHRTNSTSSHQHSPPSPTSSTSSSFSDNDQLPTTQQRRTLLHNICSTTSSINNSNTATDDATSPISPIHHARRPMNAFLIFCKKHRPVVRRKFLTLENRAVTKILGEWWALLEVEEKDAYTTLAREYKDAFFNANPNFKWYKLPAPPLRTLNTRPSTNVLLNQQTSNNNNCPATATLAGILSGHNTSTVLGINLTTSPSGGDKHKTALSHAIGGAGSAGNKDGGGAGRVEFTPGKLADESQLGNLSSLFNMSINNNIHMENSNYYSQNNNCCNTENNNNNNTLTDKSINDSNDGKQNNNVTPQAKPITKREFAPNNNQSDSLTMMFDSSSNRIYDTPVRLSENPFRTNEISTRSSFDGVRVARNLFDDDDGDGFEERKVGRKCKGQRYKEFMINGKLLKSKRDDGDDFLQTDSNSQDNSFSRPQQHIDLDTTIKMLAERTQTKIPEYPHQNQSDNAAPLEYVDSFVRNSVARPKSAINTTSNGNSAFNLDDKIALLPCLSYDQYVRRKRDSKKRNKFVRNRAHSASETTGKSKVKLSMEKSTTATLAPAASVAGGLVGSKKRKNKQNITHLKGKSAKDEKYVDKGKDVGVAPDLFGLATLAEIAANTEKLNQ